MFCTCGGRETSKLIPNYPVCCKYRELGFLGAGFPLFYQLKIYTMLVYFAMFLVVGICGLYVNYTKDNGSEWNDGRDPELPVKLSFGNFGKDKSNFDVIIFK